MQKGRLRVKFEVNRMKIVEETCAIVFKYHIFENALYEK